MAEDVDIPADRGTVPIRPPVPPILIGTLVFLASETVFFAGLFAAYLTLRSQDARWAPAEIDPVAPAVATALLVTSSGTFARALRMLRTGNRSGFRRWMALTAALGTMFLVLQLRDYAGLGFTVSSDAYGTLFYAMTGFHGVHVLAGLLLMLVAIGNEARGAFGAGRVASAEAVGYYWHFVDAVWIGLFATLYLLR